MNMVNGCQWSKLKITESKKPTHILDDPRRSFHRINRYVPIRKPVPHAGLGRHSGFDF